MSVLAAAANADVPTNVAENIGFGIIAAFMIFGALRVVTTRNVVHAALWLVLVLAGAAAQFVLLAAEFVALTQVLVYIGAIVVLFLFGIMLTKAPIGGDADLTRKSWAKQNCLLGPGALRGLFPPEARIVNLGLTLVAVVD